MFTSFPKISFGLIVLNGEPFTRYCLKALYPFAYEILVVEGACIAAKAIATPHGHSTDGTLDTLWRFKEEEDPLDKVKIITRDGFWSEKDEQSRTYFDLAEGDFVWQVDVDEFYLAKDMERIIGFIKAHPEISGISFEQITFWGGFDYVVDSWYLRGGGKTCHRVFRKEKGYAYVRHRPPTVISERGKDLRELRWIDVKTTASWGVKLYHYSLLFPKLVYDKCAYYSSAQWAGHARHSEVWAQRVFMGLENPFRVHNVYGYPSWLERFRGQHPEAIREMISDIKSGRLKVELRPTEDVEALLKNKGYRVGRALLRLGSFFYSSENLLIRRVARYSWGRWNSRALRRMTRSWACES